MNPRAATFAGNAHTNGMILQSALERPNTEADWSGGPAVIELLLLRPVTLRPRVSDGYAFFEPAFLMRRSR